MVNLNNSAKRFSILLAKKNFDVFKTTNVVSTTIRTAATSGASATTKDQSIKQDYYKQRATTNVEELSKPEGLDNARKYDEIPEPKPVPVVGNSWRFMPLIGNYHGVPLKDIHYKLREDFGDIVRFGGIIGMEDMIFLYSPKDIELVLRNEGVWPIREGLRSFKYYRSEMRPDIFKDMTGLTTFGEDWFKLRSAINPILMQPRNVQMYVQKIDLISQDFIKRIKYFSEQNPQRSMPEDFTNELNKWSLESIGYIAFEERLGCLKNDSDPKSTTQKLINAVSDMFDAMYYLETMPPCLILLLLLLMLINLLSLL